MIHVVSLKYIFYGRFADDDSSSHFDLWFAWCRSGTITWAVSIETVSLGKLDPALHQSNRRSEWIFILW